MQPAANSDTIADQQSPDVALYARYLLALKGHRRVSFIVGYGYGVMTCFFLSLILWKAWPHLGL